MAEELVPLPESFAELVRDFSEASSAERLQLLLELNDELPELPERYAGRLADMEQVHECQSPLFLAVEVDAQDVVQVVVDAPREAPTTRGVAGILHEGLDGLTAAEVLAVPDDAPYRFGLAEAVSPLRMRGMVAMLSRIKRQVREQTAS